MSDKLSTSKFDARSTAREVIAGHDLRGREAIVTGGASAIGIETIHALDAEYARQLWSVSEAAIAKAAAA
jgi:hypothetical protein